MPAIRLNAAEKKIVTSAMKDANALLKKLDADKSKSLEEPELKALMADVEKMTEKMAEADDRATAAGKKPDMLRKGMSDADRTMFAVMQGISQYADKNPGRDDIAVKDASKAIRSAYTEAFKSVKDPDAGGLMGALGVMFAAMTLPQAALPLIVQYIAARDP